MPYSGNEVPEFGKSDSKESKSNNLSIDSVFDSIPNQEQPATSKEVRKLDNTPAYSYDDQTFLAKTFGTPSQWAEDYANRGRQIAKSANLSLAGFMDNLNSMSTKVADLMGKSEILHNLGLDQKAGWFEAARNAYLQNAAKWDAKIIKHGLTDEIIGEIIGGAIPGVFEFSLNAPYAGLVGYSKGGVSEGFKQAAERALMGRLLHGINSLKVIPRTVLSAALGGSEAAVAGGNARDIAKSAATLGIFGATATGGEKIGIREARDRFLDRKAIITEEPIKEKVKPKPKKKPTPTKEPTPPSVDDVIENIDKEPVKPVKIKVESPILDENLTPEKEPSKVEITEDKVPESDWQKLKDRKIDPNILAQIVAQEHLKNANRIKVQPKDLQQPAILLEDGVIIKGPQIDRWSISEPGTAPEDIPRSWSAAKVTAVKGGYSPENAITGFIAKGKFISNKKAVEKIKLFEKVEKVKGDISKAVDYFEKNPGKSVEEASIDLRESDKIPRNVVRQAKSMYEDLRTMTGELDIESLKKDIDKLGKLRKPTQTDRMAVTVARKSKKGIGNNSVIRRAVRSFYNTSLGKRFDREELTSVAQKALWEFIRKTDPEVIKDYVDKKNADAFEGPVYKAMKWALINYSKEQLGGAQGMNRSQVESALKEGKFFTPLSLEEGLLTKTEQGIIKEGKAEGESKSIIDKQIKEDTTTEADKAPSQVRKVDIKEYLKQKQEAEKQTQLTKINQAKKAQGKLAQNIKEDQADIERVRELKQREREVKVELQKDRREKVIGLGVEGEKTRRSVKSQRDRAILNRSTGRRETDITKQYESKYENLDYPKFNSLEETIKKGSFVNQALQYIKDNSESQLNKNLAAYILDNYFKEVPMRTINAQEHLFRGMTEHLYTGPEYKGPIRVTFNDYPHGGKSGLNEETVIHESLHLLTHQLLEDGMSPSYKGTDLGKRVQELKDLQNHVIEWFNKNKKSSPFEIRPALNDIHEFVSYGFTHPKFQNILKKINFNRVTGWSKFTSSIAKLLRLSSNSSNALGHLIDITDKIVKSSGEIKYKDTQKFDSDIIPKLPNKLFNDVVSKKEEVSDKRNTSIAIANKVFGGILNKFEKAKATTFKTFDIAWQWNKRGMYKTGFALKNIFSRQDAEERLGLKKLDDFYRAIQKGFGKTLLNKETLFHIVSVTEEPKRLKEFDQDYQEKLKPAVEWLTNYFKEAQQKLKDRGIDVDYKARAISEIEQALKENTIKDYDKYLKALHDRIRLMNMEYVHIPLRMWFDTQIKKAKKAIFAKDIGGYQKAMANLQLLTTRRRQTGSFINDMVEKGIIAKEEVNPVEIILNYTRRFGHDMAIADIRDAALAEGGIKIAKSKPTKGYWEKIPQRLAALQVGTPTGKTAYIQSDIMAMIDEQLGAKFATNWYSKAMSIVKMSQFYNPLILPMYDTVQSAMATLHYPQYYPKAVYQTLKDIRYKTDNYYDMLRNGLASKPFSMPFQQWVREADIRTEQALGSNFIKAWSKAYIKELKNTPVKTLLKTPYIASWQAAWTLDEYVRLFTANVLKEAGMSTHDAAQTAAKFHADYASVPAKTRKVLNNIFFTPTFKVTMGKLYWNMITEALSNPFKESNQTVKSATFAKGFLAMMAVNVAFDVLLTKGMGMKDDQLFRRYKKTIDTDQGPKDLVITLSNPANLPFKMYQKVAKPFVDWATKENKPLMGSALLDGLFYELHPTYRIAMMFHDNKDSDGKQIVSEFQDWKIQAVDYAMFFAKELYPVLKGINSAVAGENYGSKDRQEVQKALKNDYDRLTRLFINWLAYPYLKSTDERTTQYKLESLKRRFSQEMKRDIEQHDEADEKKIERMNKMVDEMIGELENGK